MKVVFVKENVMRRKKEQLYAAYGSNLNLPQMKRRCPKAKAAGVSEIKGCELLFRGVATIEPKEDGRVPVGLWRITPEDERALDRYEGWPHLYHKEMLELELEGKPVSAMVYVMNEGRKAALPAGYYYDVIAKGYRSFGLDEKILDEAMERTMEVMKLETEIQESEAPGQGSLLHGFGL